MTLPVPVPVPVPGERDLLVRVNAIAAWELLFDRLEVREGQADGVLLIVGAAGGVGSILTQLARKLTKLTVIGTASRPETQAWVRERGAHHAIDHSKPLSAELQRVGLNGLNSVTHVASLTQTHVHYAEIVKALALQGRPGLIDDPAEPLDIMLLKGKSLSLRRESMFTRSMFQTSDMQAQHTLLNRVSGVGVIRPPRVGIYRPL